MPLYKNLLPGDPAPWFHARASTRDRFALDTAAGRYIVLCFFGSAAHPKSRMALDIAFAAPALFDDERACFFGVSADPADEAQKRVTGRIPGYRLFWDFDGEVSRLYGALPRQAKWEKDWTSFRPQWVVLDPTLRVLKVMPFADGGADGQELVSYLGTLPPPSRFAGFELQAPVLVLPNVFEAGFCETLIGLHEAHGGGEETGFMREVDGMTVQIHDHRHKRRRDHVIRDQDIILQARERVGRRLVPELLRAYQYKATRMERYIVSCYSAEDGGHFEAHRDNTTKGTAHRRFAVSINLNSDFDGGELCFPEFGPKAFKPPPGCAVVFSCSLLHAVSKVTRGRRYAFLPFLYDDEAAKIRAVNHEFLGEKGGAYSMVEAAPHSVK
jgi:peroxiredoxin